MSDRVRIAVCYKEGTQDILQVWFDSMMAHTDKPVKVSVIVVSNKAADEAVEISNIYGSPDVEVVQVTPAVVPPSRIHGAMLDAYLSTRKVEEEFFLTLDSDCFPVSDGWLNGLIRLMDGGAKLAGILHPWAPPAEDMDRKKIEWRIRSQHCWNTTHVACQMIRMKDLTEL